MAPERVVASFDSASVLHAATVAALSGRSFPHLGQSTAAAAATRLAGELPWPLLRRIYTRIGGAEGIDPADLGRVRMDDVAVAFAEQYPSRTWPAVMVGASNGAVSHLAAALQVPWLPTTLLIPVSRRGDPQRPDRALDFGRRAAEPLLRANPDIVLHQMHDAAQDELMTSRMTYFRTKWWQLPAAYEQFLDRRLGSGAPVIVVDDTSTWPVHRVGERHLFQNGGRGGISPDDYAARPFATPVDETAPEAEWGVQPDLVSSVRAWARRTGRPFARVVVPGPQAAAGPVAEVIRNWYARSGRPVDRLIVPSFVLGDPWRTLQIGAVPYWTFFAVRPAVDALARYLESAEPYHEARVMMFQHGADSPGAATPDDFRRVLRDHRIEAQFVALHPDRVPHDIGSLARYGPELAALPDEPVPWTPLPVDEALAGLDSAGLTVERPPG